MAQKRQMFKGMLGVLFAAVIAIFVHEAHSIYLEIGPRQNLYNKAADTALTGERIGGLVLLQSVRTITPALLLQQGHDDYDYYNGANGLTIATGRGSEGIVRIAAARENRTAKGIGIGSKREDVIAAYGKGYYKRSEQGASVIGYVDKTAGQTLEFWLLEGKVAMIRLDSADME
ncbi:hypothetical protein [Paenibacillus sp. MBLB4367]|uniref:hypothetical protein n=1 Tax=Paenibacillus sp. MBLB4367 TaxID=3384767 RepID=UPI003908339D